MARVRTASESERVAASQSERVAVSQSERVVTFGLGQQQAVDSITVVWPGGEREVFEVPAIDRTIRLQQGAGKIESKNAEESK